MSLSREITIWCDDCMQWEQRSGLRVPTVRRELKAQGWTCRRVDGETKDYCPDCSEKRRKP